MSARTDYKAELNQRFWDYQRANFPRWEGVLQRPEAQDGRPPVFIRREAWRNVILAPDASQDETDRVLAFIALGERHKWFGSMSSSQALAQSVFANLAVNGLLDWLGKVPDDEGMPLFGDVRVSRDNFEMEHMIDYLGEPRQTSLDGYVSGDYRIAIECKFTEAEVGTCSRPRLKKSEEEYCSGIYSVQGRRLQRCALAEIGVMYWQYVPELFSWRNDADLYPCPLNKNYQLVRNVLAIGVKPDKTAALGGGHALLIYDERNPAFQPGGDGASAFLETRSALRATSMLRKCSWQRIVGQIRREGLLPWLTESLSRKYGL